MITIKTMTHHCWHQMKYLSDPYKQHKQYKHITSLSLSFLNDSEMANIIINIYDNRLNVKLDEEIIS